jgi:hypothetical protein
MNSLLLLGQKTAKQIGKDAPHWGAVWAGDDAYPGAAPIAKHTPELLQSEAGIWKELQTKLADDSIKAAIWKW